MARGEVTGFVDESIRGQRYLTCCVLIPTNQLSEVRSIVRQFAGKKRRLHFRHESNQIRKSFLETVSSLKIESFVIETRMRNGINSRTARAKCIEYLIRHVQGNQLASRLIIEDFSDSRSDLRLIQSVRTKNHVLNFEHQDGGVSPELWIADAIAWATGHGPEWSSQVKGILRDHFVIT